MKRKNLLLASMLLGAFAISNANAKSVLFLTNRDDAVNPADQIVIDALEDEDYDVTVKISGSFDAATDLDGTDLIFVSEAIGSMDPATLYAAEAAGSIGIGIINCEPYAYQADRFPWLGNPSKGSTGYDKVFVTEAGAEHSIMMNAEFAASTSEEDAVQVLEQADEAGDPCGMTWILASDVTTGTILATDGGEEAPKALVVAVEKGTECGEYVTTGRRAHFFVANKSNNLFTEEGATLFIETVKWCIEGNSLESGIANATEGVQYKYANNNLVVEEAANVEIFAISGELCSSLNQVTSVDCSSLNKGIYIARISSDSKTSVCKISVK